MNPIAELHLKAMDLCDLADAARLRHDHTQAVQLFRRAYETEREAAAIVAGDFDLEPTRSILHRSAASLALECGEIRAAEKLIATALAGEPPGDVAEELRDLLEQVNFGRHLELRGLELAPDELQLSIEGNATGLGMAQSDEFIDRVQASEKLFIRTIERKSGRPFREAGRAIKEIARNFDLYLSTPRAASFAVTLRVGRPQKQLNLPNMDQITLREPEKIIDDLMDCLDSFGRKDQARLQALIPDETYRRNFVALAERLAPDGNQVKVVGLTTTREGAERKVALIQRRPPERQQVTGNGVAEPEIVGRLLFASATSQSKKIKIVDDESQSHIFSVPDGMMVDIVKPLWEDRVVAQGVRKGNVVRLTKIARAEE